MCWWYPCMISPSDTGWSTKIICCTLTEIVITEYRGNGWALLNMFSSGLWFSTSRDVGHNHIPNQDTHNYHRRLEFSTWLVGLCIKQLSYHSSMIIDWPSKSHIYNHIYYHIHLSYLNLTINPHVSPWKIPISSIVPRQRRGRARGRAAGVAGAAHAVRGGVATGGESHHHQDAKWWNWGEGWRVISTNRYIYIPI